MESVIIQLPDAPGVGPVRQGRPQQLVLHPGKTATFGRGSVERPVDIPLSGEGISRFAGEITAGDDHWRLTNFSPQTTYVVENLEGGGGYVKVTPRRLGAPIPFELSRVVLPLTDGFVRFTVFAARHTFLDPGPEPPVGRTTELTLTPFALDPTAKYFLVLLALCEPRLRDPSSLAIPTVGEVVNRLRALPQCRDLTVSAANFHIDYLAGTKLKVRERAGAQDSPRLDWKREALVSIALRFDLIQEKDLEIFWNARA
ncbi:serine/threonine protein kinase [Streptacidiphilus sp. MAP5-3]|uniref:serine/threonine protein kinase n=1 Tax=unclassified Streptacidiphilus TaxID=2643834 RepID=UPI003510DA9C